MASKLTDLNPGSDAAVEAGCTCAVMDNARGAGVKILGEGPFWWIEGDCPLHGFRAGRQALQKEEAGLCAPNSGSENG